VSEGPSDDSTGGPAGDQIDDRRDGVVVDVLVYASARLLLVAALSGAIYGVARLLGVVEFPIIVAVLFAFIIGMPLGIWLFTPLRRRATAALAIVGERRRQERETLQARLRGDTVRDEAPHNE
jgi:hypothetical protein